MTDRGASDATSPESRGQRRALRMKGIAKAFAGRTILNGVDLEIGSGELVALLGASGSGKTTILRMVAGLDSPDGGEVLVVRARSVVFQEPRLVQSKRVWQNVVLGLGRGRARRASALESLREVGLDARSEQWPATLSGGEAQRVALARALVRQPDLLLLDEPFAALDALTRVRMQQLLIDLLQRHHIAALIVTHDVQEAVLLADRILVLRDGQISLEVRMDKARPRSLSDLDVVRQASRLLAELGVSDGRGAPPTAGTGPLASGIYDSAALSK